MTLATEWGGLRFIDAGIERAFRDWARRDAASHIRAGMIASALAWGALAVAIAASLPPVFAWLWPLVVMALASCGGLYGLARSRWLVPLYPAVAAGNAMTGWIIGVAMKHGLPADVALAVSVIVLYFGFTIYRLPVRWSAPAALSYVVLFLSYLSTEEGARTFLYGAVLLIALVTGSFAAVVIERLQRSAFRQEQLIGEQRATIERMLKQEISHQVAERSKQLGEVLAKVDVALPSQRLEPGRSFAERYSVVRQLGAGGMGAVYEVERTTDRARLALKVVTGNVTGAQAARFAREAEIGARIRHPNLVQIVDVGVSGAGVPFLVMELVTGGSLEDRRDRFGDSAWGRPVLAQIARGLAALHEAGVVHRDLKPGNVLLSGEQSAPHALISDFGISRFGVIEGGDPLGETAEAKPGLKGQSLTRTGALIGTPLYMAPEAAQGGQAVGQPADVFAFGLLAYETLSGRFPFPAPPVLELMEGRTVPPPVALEGAAGALVLRCLALAPERRPSIAEVAAALT